MKGTSISNSDVKALILKETFKLLLVRNPESITVTDLESAIGFTRGSIFYHMKNKKDVIEKAMSTHLFSSFNPYFPINSIHINTLKQYIEEKTNHLLSIYKWLEEEGIRLNIGTTYFHILSQLEVYYPQLSELMFDMREKDKQQWEKILNMAIVNGEIKTDINIKQLANVFCDSYTGYLVYDFRQKQDTRNSSLYFLYELIKLK